MRTIGERCCENPTSTNARTTAHVQGRRPASKLRTLGNPCVLYCTSYKNTVETNKQTNKPHSWREPEQDHAGGWNGPHAAREPKATQWYLYLSTMADGIGSVGFFMRTQIKVREPKIKC